MSSKFTHRSSQEEIMDDLQLGGEEMDQTLRELEVINTLLGGNNVTINGLSKLIPKRTTQISIVDIGCGGGDMLRLIAKWGRKAKIPMALIGVDANPHVIRFAQHQSKEFPEISYKELDIFSNEFESIKCDIITATLFTHHFSNEQLISLFVQFRSQAKLGLVVNDIHRHWFAYHSINTLTRLFSKSSMVRHDAGVSVLRSFRKAELEKILQEAGVASYSLRWMWAFRWQLVASW